VIGCVVVIASFRKRKRTSLNAPNQEPSRPRFIPIKIRPLAPRGLLGFLTEQFPSFRLIRWSKPCR
jgi:hypothetical protein